MKQDKKMNLTIKIEEAAITAFSIYFLSKYNLGMPPLGVDIAVFFSPDKAEFRIPSV